MLYLCQYGYPNVKSLTKTRFSNICECFIKFINFIKEHISRLKGKYVALICLILLDGK